MKDSKILGKETKDEKNRRLVKELYEKYPYPNRGFKTRKEAISYVEWVSKIFNKKTDFWKNKNVLELGCGSGELAVGLSLVGAKVKAIDLSSSSIKKAQELSKKLNTQNVEFFQEDIFLLDNKKNEEQEKSKEFERNEEYDVVIALGSLHHTVNAKKAFLIGVKKLKKEGLIIIGLYNKYSRFRHRVKRVILRVLCGENIEKRISTGEKLFGGNKSKSWLADKYGQVHESYHSINEIKKWFSEQNIEFISSKPKCDTPILDEIFWLLTKKNAFFVMVGKKTK